MLLFKLDLCERIPSTLRSCDADLSAGSHMIPCPKNFLGTANLPLCSQLPVRTEAVDMIGREPERQLEGGVAHPSVCNAVKSQSASFT